MTQHEILSADGTHIGFERRGRGPALVAVHGATANRNRWAMVADALAEHFTLFAMDRRGRGLSLAEAAGDYSLAREAEDVRAVVAAAGAATGAPVYLFGHSYGGLCVLEAAREPAGIAKLLVYEPAFATTGFDVIGPGPLAELAAIIDAGYPELALEQFYLRVIGVDPLVLAAMKTMPNWQPRLETVPTLVREGRAADAWRPEHLAKLRMPLRFLVGGISPPWLRAAAYAAHAAAPGSSLVELPGQAHAAMDTDPALFVAEMLAFWNDGKPDA